MLVPAAGPEEGDLEHLQHLHIFVEIDRDHGQSQGRALIERSLSVSAFEHAYCLPTMII